MNLLIDTAHRPTLGISKNEKRWAFFKEYKIEKSSSIVFCEIYYKLKRLGLKVRDLKGIFISLGPGSYTGIRLGLGLFELYKEIGPPVFGHHTHKILEHMAPTKGVFTCPAHKGEKFLYDLETQKGQLISEETPEEKDVFTHRDFLALVEDNPEMFFQKAREHQQSEAFYFRPLEKEFRISRPQHDEDLPPL